MQPKATESAAKRSPKAYLKGVLAVTRIVYAALDRLEEPPPLWDTLEAAEVKSKNWPSLNERLLRQSHKDEEKKRNADANNWTLVGRETHRVQPKLRRRNQIRKVRMPSFQTKTSIRMQAFPAKKCQRGGSKGNYKYTAHIAISAVVTALHRSLIEAQAPKARTAVEVEIIDMVAISMSQDMDLILKL